MARTGYGLPSKKRFPPRLKNDGFWIRKMERMICAYKRPLMGGFYGGKDAPRGGTAWGAIGGFTCPWSFERDIKNGYWAGPLRRKHLREFDQDKMLVD